MSIIKIKITKVKCKYCKSKFEVLPRDLIISNKTHYDFYMDPYNVKVIKTKCPCCNSIIEIRRV